MSGSKKKTNRHARPVRPLRPLRLALVIAVVSCAVLFSAGLLRTGLSGLEGGSFAASSPTPQPTATAAPTPTPAPTPLVETVTFSATGDDLIHSRIYNQARARAQSNGSSGYDFAYCYANMASFYAGFDVNWINQETLVNDALEPSTYPAFSTPGDCGRALYDIGFRVFSMSNNHSYDKGTKGISATRRFWAEMPDDVVTCGLWTNDIYAIPTQTVNGVTIAYLAYTEHTNGISIASSAEAKVIYTSQTDVIENQVTYARSIADVVVVGVHWGVEDSHTTTDAQRTLAQSLADWGADVIIGTHPHVIQNAEWLTAADGRETFVAYSLGNFISTQKQADNLIGAVLTFTIQKTTQPGGSVEVLIKTPKLHPIVTHYSASFQNVRTYLYRDYSPELANSHGAWANNKSFSFDFITGVVQKNISAEFLELS